MPGWRKINVKPCFFDQQKEQIVALGFDEGFIRLWRFYLAACAAAFRTNKNDVMQIELTHA